MAKTPMDNAQIQKIGDVLQKSQSIGIVVGRNPNLDEMAAALSLYLSLHSLEKKVSVASPTEPIVEISSLVGIDKVKTGFFGDSGGDLVVSFPYQEGEIEKVSYTLENGYLNIIVKAGSNGLSFREEDVRYKRGGGNVALDTLFVVGTPRLSDLGNLFDPEVLKDVTVVNVDNKNDNQGFGEVVYVSSKNSSVSEMVANLINQLRLPLDVDIAQNLLSGISHATNNFQNPRTSFLAFEIVSLLLRKGAIRDTNYGLPQGTAFGAKMPPKKTFAPPPPKPRDQRGGQFPKQPFFEDEQDLSFPSPIGASQKGQARQDRQSYAPPKARPQEVVEKVDKTTPSDWLAPKIYKGSTEV